MPFTLAHPAAVIPLKKSVYGRYFSLSALIVGSIVPDIGYLVPVAGFIGFSHSLGGVLAFGLPTGLLILWIFHNALKRSFISLLPHHHRQLLLVYCAHKHCGLFPSAPWQRFSTIVISLFIGALTHIGWDSMTHGHGWIVQNLPFFLTPVPTFSDMWTRLYFVFKHSSTVIGLTLLIYWYWQWFSSQSAGRTETIKKVSRWKDFVRLVSFVAFAGVGGMILASLSLEVGYETLSLSVKWIVAAFGMGIGIYTLIHKAFGPRAIAEESD